MSAGQLSGDYLNNRYHDPSTGLFLSVDPLVAATGMPYLYGNGNPTTLADPDGLCAGREGSKGGCGVDYYGGGGQGNGALYCGQGTHGLQGGVCNTYGKTNPGDDSWDKGTKYIALTACGSKCHDKLEDELLSDYGFNDRTINKGAGWALLGAITALITGPEVVVGAVAFAAWCAEAPFLCKIAVGTAGRYVAGPLLDESNGAPTFTPSVAPFAESNLEHVFRRAAGHLAEDTPANRSLIQSAVESGSLVRTTPQGVDIYQKMLPNGTQVWAQVYGGEITNGGLNQTPRGAG